MRKNRTILLWLLAAAVLAGLSLALWQYNQSRFITIGGTRYSRQSQTLDLSGVADPDLDSVAQLRQLKSLDLRGTGITADEYDRLHAALPECTIQWDIPFQGSFYSLDTRQLSVASLSQEDLQVLARFPSLSQVDATACADLANVKALQALLPDCQILWQLTVGGQVYSKDTAALTVDNGDEAELDLALQYLPKLQSLHLTGTLPPAQWLRDTLAQYPHLELTWEYPLFGRVLTQDVEELDLSGILMENTDAVEAAIPYLPSLKKVIMCDCGIPDEEMDALGQRYPHIRFVWTITLSRCSIRTDITTFMAWKYDYLPGYPMYDKDAAKLKYCVDIVCLDLGHMQIKNISFLEHMTKLQYLVLGDSPVKDISPLANLKELKFLELFLTEVDDISPLAGCTKLEDVNLSWLVLEDISPLSGLENLKNVWLISAMYPQEDIKNLIEQHPDAVFKQAWGTSSTGLGWRDLENYLTMRELLEMPAMPDWGG